MSVCHLWSVWSIITSACNGRLITKPDLSVTTAEMHDDVIKWKHFPRYLPFVRGIHRSPVNSPHKGQWRGTLMFSLICIWINSWVNNREADDLRRYRAHYDVIVMVYHAKWQRELYVRKYPCKCDRAHDSLWNTTAVVPQREPMLISSYCWCARFWLVSIHLKSLSNIRIREKTYDTIRFCSMGLRLYLCGEAGIWNDTTR